EAMKLPLPEGRTLDELRTAAVAALTVADVRRLPTVVNGLPEDSYGFDIDRVALRFYARGNRQGNVTLRRLDDDGELAQLPGRGVPRRIICGLDGKSLVLFDEKTGDLEHWTMGGPPPRTVATIAKPWPLAGVPQLSRDGRRVLLVGDSGKELQ